MAWTDRKEGDWRGYQRGFDGIEPTNQLKVILTDFLQILARHKNQQIQAKSRTNPEYLIA